MHRKPFNVGSRVAVKRARHGWYDGKLLGTVTERHQRPTGTYHYVVKDDQGQHHEVVHTRDLCAAT